MNTKSLEGAKNECICWCGASAGVRAFFWGILLVLLGSLGLLQIFVPIQGLGMYLLPAFLILWGGFILVSRFSRQ